jgi:hypothetical protein
MKTSARVAAFAAVLVLFIAATGSAKALRFRYSAELRGPFFAGSMYRIPLGPEILERCTPGLTDLRVIGPVRNVIPAGVRVERPGWNGPASWPLEIVGYDEKGRNSSTVTLRLPEAHSAIDSIDLDISGNDFRRRVELFSGRDGSRWTAIATGEIYDFSSRVPLRKTRLGIPRTTDRFFRIVLTTPEVPPTGSPGDQIRLKYRDLEFSAGGAANAGPPIRIRSASAAGTPEGTVEWDECRLETHEMLTSREGDTVIRFETAIPVERIRFECDDPYFFRMATWETSESGKDDSWQPVARLPLSRFPLDGEHGETVDTLAATSAGHRFHRLTIANRRNPPLALRSILIGWSRRSLYLVAPTNADKYDLVFGNPAAPAPEYDLERLLTPAVLSRTRFETVFPGTFREDRTFEPEPTPRSREEVERTVLVGVVLALVVGLGFWLMRLLRR